MVSQNRCHALLASPLGHNNYTNHVLIIIIIIIICGIRNHQDLVAGLVEVILNGITRAVSYIHKDPVVEKWRYAVSAGEISQALPIRRKEGVFTERLVLLLKTF